MSCACENLKLGREIERFRRLAKAWAKLENQTAVIYKKDNGTYGFGAINDDIKNEIVEYVTPY